ncbi:MAG: hypothetical protein Q8K75_01430 [Chlamydiales bacterium]|nr:hypothetical protein [Chlamydiales bacterium]
MFGHVDNDRKARGHVISQEYIQKRDAKSTAKARAFNELQERFDTQISNIKKENCELRQQLSAMHMTNLAMFNAIMAFPTSKEVRAQKYEHGTYVGEFSKGKRSGELLGEFIFNDGSSFNGKWEGEKYTDGTLKDSVGTFIGTFDNGERKEGVQTYKNGHWFEGTWRKGKRDNGIFCDGLVRYEGSFNSKDLLAGYVNCTFLDLTNGLVEFNGFWDNGHPFFAKGTYTSTVGGNKISWEDYWKIDKLPPKPPTTNPTETLTVTPR